MTDILLRADGVARRFGNRVALQPTDLELHAGEAVALVGPNGAGKSTLLSILAGALAPSEGRVETRAGVTVGWVPQRPAQYARLSPRENLELFARLEGLADPCAVAERLLARFSLPRDGRASGDLSVGNRQRLNVALALIGEPRMLLLDEPTASLDPGQRRRLWETVAEVQGAGGAVCFATQNVEELDHYADRVVALIDGGVAFAGPTSAYTSSVVDVFAG